MTKMKKKTYIPPLSCQHHIDMQAAVMNTSGSEEGPGANDISDPTVNSRSTWGKNRKTVWDEDDNSEE